MLYFTLYKNHTVGNIYSLNRRRNGSSLVTFLGNVEKKLSILIPVTVYSKISPGVQNPHH